MGLLLLLDLEWFHLIHIDGNHQMVVQQGMNVGTFGRRLAILPKKKPLISGLELWNVILGISGFDD